eukprot:bmy_21242T0
MMKHFLAHSSPPVYTDIYLLERSSSPLNSRKELQEGSCSQVKTSRSSAHWDILETGLCSEEKVVRFTRNDSRSFWGENWAFHNMQDQHLTQERRLRNNLVESLCEGKEGQEGHQCLETLNQIIDLTVHKSFRTGIQPHQCIKCGKAFRDHSFQKNQQRSYPGHKHYPCEECGQACSCISCLSPLRETDIVEKPEKHQDAGRASKRCCPDSGVHEALCLVFSHPHSGYGAIRGETESGLPGAGGGHRGAAQLRADATGTSWLGAGSARSPSPGLGNQPLVSLWPVTRGRGGAWLNCPVSGDWAGSRQPANQGRKGPGGLPIGAGAGQGLPSNQGAGPGAPSNEGGRRARSEPPEVSLSGPHAGANLSRAASGVASPSVLPTQVGGSPGGLFREPGRRRRW